MFFNNNYYKQWYSNIFKFCSVEKKIIRLRDGYRQTVQVLVMNTVLLDTDLIIFIGTTKQANDLRCQSLYS